MNLLERARYELYIALGMVWLELATPRRGHRLRRGLPYGSLPRHRLDLYEPDDVAPFTPVVVFFYGGGWRSGGRLRYRWIGQSFASAGLIVAIPDYRLYPATAFPGFVDDAAAAVAWVAKHVAAPDGGPRPLILMGVSAGAHIAALLHLDRRRLAAAGLPEYAVAGAVGISGPYDFLPIKDPRYRSVFPPGTEHDSQPINFVDGTASPMLLVTGDADETVDPANTTRLADAIRARGGAVSVTVYPGADHTRPLLGLARAIPGEKLPVRAEILDFIRTVTGYAAKGAPSASAWPER